MLSRDYSFCVSRRSFALCVVEKRVVVLSRAIWRACSASCGPLLTLVSLLMLHFELCAAQWFGTFRCDSEAERRRQRLSETTLSIW